MNQFWYIIITIINYQLKSTAYIRIHSFCSMGFMSSEKACLIYTFGVLYSKVSLS